jgi:hypothetical protein
MKAKSKKSSQANCPYKVAEGKALKENNLLAANPLKQQFEPTSTESVRQHNAMAGGS